jgi:hydroxyacylglutathione hydrolase
MFFQQICTIGDNFSYLIADQTTKEAAVVDTSYNAQTIIRMVQDEDFHLKYIINTHGHADHTAGNREVQLALGGKTVAHSTSKIDAELAVNDGDVLHVGQVEILVLYTPGHTPDGICLLVNGQKLLTGDTLFVGECGRTDLPGGNARNLYDSLFNKLLKLNDAIEVYPGHDYGLAPSSTIGEQRHTNYVLEPRSAEDFVTFMSAP